ncbi:MAG: dual specificity protein phosphatase family protein, partial [Proteobacteria bacterium]|nr:dual specificity protein phosphatase family protein [Pseudomonadota bacterium]
MEPNKFIYKPYTENGLQPSPHPQHSSYKMKLAIAIIAAIFILASFAIADESGFIRPASWAQPVMTDGVPNLYKVSNDLYRSAQPTEQGMKNLKQTGIKTVVNLRSFHSDRDIIENTGIEYEHIYMKAWHPERKEVVRFLQIVTNPNRTPVLLHCLHGADRTGTMCALYRIVVQGWTKEEAIREMT